MKLAYLILFMMAVTAVFGRTLSKRGDKDEKDGKDEKDEKDGKDEKDEKDEKDKDNSKESNKIKGCSCFTDTGVGGDDSGDDSDHEKDGRNDGRGGRFDGHSTYGRLNRFNPAPAGPGRHGSFCRNDDGSGNGNVRSCPSPSSFSRCTTDCCRYCCFNTPKSGGD